MTATPSPLTVHRFAMRFSSTPRGARLARHLCAHRLDVWGVPYGTDAHESVVLVVAELCANAVRHGRVAGRDFHVLLTLAPAARTVRIEVTDTRGERLPCPSAAGTSAGEVRDGGRGLLLVEALADRWGFGPRADSGPGKTVWAECVV
ncbi:ATP-binding protein [Streptomyces thermoviolaceus]|uniref:ATP-binding protein n=1 Tax=Streptomyces thermoviolaceus TaxID=1952 RepID=UPI001E401472|nr:ATP-binding protein [Streptomyces thermoviolaceus]MCM3266184.1 ATP-binding protein [Streptomyces thermoviolaceus]WTD46590.1 ATP-binding protein [Streptomyces thermoviolaceus]